jgi:hypothetical protein
MVWQNYWGFSDVFDRFTCILVFWAGAWSPPKTRATCGKTRGCPTVSYTHVASKTVLADDHICTYHTPYTGANGRAHERRVVKWEVTGSGLRLEAWSVFAIVNSAFLSNMKWSAHNVNAEWSEKQWRNPTGSQALEDRFRTTTHAKIRKFGTIAKSILHCHRNHADPAPDLDHAAFAPPPRPFRASFNGYCSSQDLSTGGLMDVGISTTRCGRVLARHALIMLSKSTASLILGVLSFVLYLLKLYVASSCLC